MARVVCWFILLSLTMSSSSSISFATDQSTLVALRNHIITANPDHFLPQNWSETTSICNWAGVSCGSGLQRQRERERERVSALNISNMELKGTIPSSLLGNLSFLVSLDFSNNHFYGELPHDLSALPRLRAIFLYSNTFTGFIPSSFSNISELQTLVISSNQLRGNIPQQIGNLSNLKEFYGAMNMLSGAIPSGIGKLRMLQHLQLANNMLHGTIPEEISNLYNLQEIGVSNNSLSGSIPIGIFNISTLTIISMSSNNLSGTLPSTLGHNLPNLASLEFDNNHLTGKIPDSISNSSRLTRIALPFNNLTGPIPNSLGALKLLDCLQLYGNQLTNDAPDQELSFLTALTNCPNLRDLALTDNPLRGFLPPSIGNLSTSLVRIYLSDCMIMGRIPDEIGNLSYLNRLDIRSNDLSGFIPSTIRGLRRLQGLFLGDNMMQGSLPDNLCEMPQLSLLIVRQNRISGPIPGCVGNVTSLRSIDLGLNRLSSSIPLSIWNLKDLLELDLSSNSLIGSLPHEIQNLKVATYINLSRNGFTGVIHDAFGSMQNLINFSLASNKLQGSIPKSLGKMISLVSLDLSNNSLSGEIPKELEGLKFLTYFNVSFNKLSGEIPREGPFKNFNYLFFASNEALCGAPQLHVPRCHDSSSHSKKMRRRRMIVIVSAITGSLTLTALLVLYWIMRRRRRAAIPEADHDDSYGKSMERFSYQQLKQATNDFSHDKLLGSGSFGSVYLADFQNGIAFAVKVFNLQQKYASKSFETECEMLSKLRHRNLTKVISACSNLDFKALLLEYMQNGSLEDWLYGDGYFLDILQRVDVMIDVALALEYLHHGYVKPVVHCDVKPSNILLDRDMVGHVTDFGITKLLGEEQSIVHTQTMATLGYMAPEYGTVGVVSSACDVYSYGIVLMETFTRKRPCDQMFGGELSLRSWVTNSMLLPNSLSQIVDSTLITQQQQQQEDDQHFTEKMQCVSSVFSLALACTVESPKDRINIKDVSTALKKIKLHFISTTKLH